MTALADDCQTGCMWRIPNRVEDMTDRQREALGLREERAKVARVAYDEPPRFEPIPSRRYVTDWKADE